MERLIFTCPTTGTAVDIGIESDIATLLKIRGEAVRAQCPACGQDHEWQVNDAQLATPADQTSLPSGENT